MKHNNKMNKRKRAKEKAWKIHTDINAVIDMFAHIEVQRYICERSEREKNKKGWHISIRKRTFKNSVEE